MGNFSEELRKDTFFCIFVITRTDSTSFKDRTALFTLWYPTNDEHVVHEHVMDSEI